jgi:hypothetical protein
MKNKILILALLVIFVSVSFMGCGGDSPKRIKEVTVTPKTIPAVKIGDVEISPAIEGYILSWEAKGKNVITFEIFASLEDKASIFELSASARNDITVTGPGSTTYGDTIFYYSDGSSGPANSDPDKWSVWVSKENYSVMPGTKDYYFGVRTMSWTDEYSNIRWSKDKYALKNGD